MITFTKILEQKNKTKQKNQQINGLGSWKWLFTVIKKGLSQFW